MANELYDAFVEAGLEREARTLSTTVSGNVVSELGHYIAIADNFGAKFYQKAKSKSPSTARNTLLNYPEKYGLLEQSIKKIKEYVVNLCDTEKDSEKIKKLASKLMEMQIIK